LGGAKWEEAERLQNAVARRILKVGEKTSVDFLRGELGWWSMQARRDRLRLRFLWKLVNMADDRMVKKVYHYARDFFTEALVNGKDLELSQKHNMSWCEYTFVLMQELGLETKWYSERFGSKQEWEVMITKAIHDREQKAWIKSMAVNSKLNVYRIVKPLLCTEEYLLDESEPTARVELTRFRSGNHRLRVNLGRFDGLLRKDRICEFCEMELEDERHALFRCRFFEVERKQLIEEVFQESRKRIGDWDEEKKIQFLLNSKKKGFAMVRKPLARYLLSMAKARRDWESHLC
jgi:hypothetical protein